jgi:hypothetical protein
MFPLMKSGINSASFTKVQLRFVTIFNAQVSKEAQQCGNNYDFNKDSISHDHIGHPGTQNSSKLSQNKVHLVTSLLPSLGHIYVILVYSSNWINVHWGYAYTQKRRHKLWLRIFQSKTAWNHWKKTLTLLVILVFTLITDMHKRGQMP